MTAAAERMRAMRTRRRLQGLRKRRLVVPDARSTSVRGEVAKQMAQLTPERERDTPSWIEAVSEFDADEAR